jgi:hypothetical protein
MCVGSSNKRRPSRALHTLLLVLATVSVQHLPVLHLLLLLLLLQLVLAVHRWPQCSVPNNQRCTRCSMFIQCVS